MMVSAALRREPARIGLAAAAFAVAAVFAREASQVAALAEIARHTAFCLASMSPPAADAPPTILGHCAACWGAAAAALAGVAALGWPPRA